MNLVRKSDVSNDLSATDTSVYPFGLQRSDVETATETQQPRVHSEAIDISISPSHPIAPEAVPNAQVGGSVGIPRNAEKSGKGPW